MVATLVVLLLPAAVVGPVLEACCGVYPSNLQVSDTPDPVCLEEKVTISGTYTVIPQWDPWEAYDTGVGVKIWEPGGVDPVVNEDVTLAKGQTEAPKDFTFSYPYLPLMAGTYNYEVIACRKLRLPWRMASGSRQPRFGGSAKCRHGKAKGGGCVVGLTRFRQCSDGKEIWMFASPRGSMRSFLGESLPCSRRCMSS
jgi:hypothetical protein